MNSFGDAVRQLMEAKKVSGLKLAESIGITPTSVSRILTGQSRPRQVTLTRIMQQLCQTQDEEQLLIRAYSGLESLPQEAVNDDKRNAEEEEARVKRFLEVSTANFLAIGCITEALLVSPSLSSAHPTPNLHRFPFALPCSTRRVR